MDRVPAMVHQTTWATECEMEFIAKQREGLWVLSINIHDPHPPFNLPQAYRKYFDPAQMPDPLYRESDLVQQQKLSSINFQSRVAHTEALELHDPILPRTPTSKSVRPADP